MSSRPLLETANSLNTRVRAGTAPEFEKRVVRVHGTGVGVGITVGVLDPPPPQPPSASARIAAARNILGLFVVAIGPPAYPYVGMRPKTFPTGVSGNRSGGGGVSDLDEFRLHLTMRARQEM